MPSSRRHSRYPLIRVLGRVTTYAAQSDAATYLPMPPAILLPEYEPMTNMEGEVCDLMTPQTPYLNRLGHYINNFPKTVLTVYQRLPVPRLARAA